LPLRGVTNFLEPPQGYPPTLRIKYDLAGFRLAPHPVAGFIQANGTADANGHERDLDLFVLGRADGPVPNLEAFEARQARQLLAHLQLLFGAAAAGNRLEDFFCFSGLVVLDKVTDIDEPLIARETLGSGGGWCGILNGVHREMRRARMLPAEQILNKVSRYEAHLSRLLYKAMHELEALQTRRVGGTAGPSRRGGAAGRDRR